jgi:hypothetical protein
MYNLEVYKDDNGLIRVEKTKSFSLNGSFQKVKWLPESGLEKVMYKKHFGAYTLDGAYRYAYSAYVDAAIDQWDITPDIADTIFMMAEKEKLPV